MSTETEKPETTSASGGQNELLVMHPLELNEETRFILGRPNFWCGSMAMRMRELGHEIPKKSEEEQAHVIHWMLGLYELHGADWREHAETYLKGA